MYLCQSHISSSDFADNIYKILPELHVQWSNTSQNEIRQKFVECKGGYDIPGMILLRNLQGATRLNLTISILVPVSTCTMYDFNALTPAMWKLRR
jgi:hypothetical protein